MTETSGLDDFFEEDLDEGFFEEDLELGFFEEDLEEGFEEDLCEDLGSGSSLYVVYYSSV